MRSLFRILLGLVALLVVLGAVVFARAAFWRSKQVVVAPAPALEFDLAASARRLSDGLKIATVSSQGGVGTTSPAFAEFRAYLEKAYPLAHGALERLDSGSTDTLLFRWNGSDPALAPVLLMGHQDVVPAAPDTLDSWEHPPFSGEIDGEFVWGRGAIDDKANVLGVLEAIELHVAAGARPRRTVYLSFGHDEELGGAFGAARVAERFRREGVRFEFVLDEGLCVVDGMVPGVDAPVALVGVAEKGYLTLQLTVKDAGGHSSMPPRKTALGKLARAADRLETAQMPGGIVGVVRDMFDHVGPEMDFPMRVLFANLWLFGPVVEKKLEAERATNAALRTTTAVTMMQGSVKENILPLKASGAVNFRLRPGDTIEDVVEHVRRATDDPEVEIEIADGAMQEASSVSRVDSEGFDLLRRTIRETFPNAIVAPGLVVGATDCKHFEGLSDSVYRFQPQTLAGADLARIHGVNERLSLENWRRTIAFYHRLLANAAL